MPHDHDNLTPQERAIMRAYLSIPAVRNHYAAQGIYPADWDDILGKPVTTRHQRRITRDALLKLRANPQLRSILQNYITINKSDE